MSQAIPSDSKLSLVPLGADDLIDCVVRFCQRNLGPLRMIVPPAVAVMSIGWTFLERTLVSLGRAGIDRPASRLNATPLNSQIHRHQLTRDLLQNNISSRL